ncbi:uncharacterized protein SPSK_06664 [Sporothrix schenckii 1099-18]|uniref:Uncharacterized protein n=1 Tax=Sporothrix schenckii 1099-18 TaxID=1397361 RepID=A0A0F2MKU5_SPOSC|nr:uncharacterized protein SPSK_06664 [Sporothrix schenckii 1099-18]KJR89430.1 hypothetical protein SPSK_06664 [Sporothrix schenckii 1099-18]
MSCLVIFFNRAEAAHFATRNTRQVPRGHGYFPSVMHDMSYTLFTLALVETAMTTANRNQGEETWSQVDMIGCERSTVGGQWCGWTKLMKGCRVWTPRETGSWKGCCTIVCGSSTSALPCKPAKKSAIHVDGGKEQKYRTGAETSAKRNVGNY